MNVNESTYMIFLLSWTETGGRAAICIGPMGFIFDHVVVVVIVIVIIGIVMVMGSR